MRVLSLAARQAALMAEAASRRYKMDSAVYYRILFQVKLNPLIVHILLCVPI